MLRRSPVALKNHDRKKRGKEACCASVDRGLVKTQNPGRGRLHPASAQARSAVRLITMIARDVSCAQNGTGKAQAMTFDVELLFYPRGSFIQFISSPSAFHQSGLYSPCLHDAFDVLLVTAAMTGVWPILADRCVSPKISIRPKSHLICQYNSQVSEPYMSVGSSVRLVSGAYLSASWLRPPAYVFP